MRAVSLGVLWVSILAVSLGSVRAETVLPLLEYSGREIVALTTEGGRLPPGEFRQLVTLRPGEPLSPAMIRESILNLYRTGRFEQVRVTGVEDEAGGVAVHFSLVPRRWLDQVIFEGNLRIGDPDLLSVINLGLEQEVEDERLFENIERLMDYYAHRGFPEAEIGYRVRTDAEQRSKIIFSVREGLRSKISDIRLTGDAGFSRLKLLSKISSTIGDEFDGKLLDRDREEIREWLKERRHYYPEVTVTDEPDSLSPGNRVVTFRVDRGERFELTVTGEAPEDRRRILRWLDDYYSEMDTEIEAREAVVERVKDLYVKTGHPFVSTQWEEARVEGGVRLVTLLVNRGQRAVISGITVEGVDRFSVAQLGEILELEPGQAFVRARVDQALVRLEEAYRQDGYLFVDAAMAPLQFLPDERQQTVAIRIDVVEGERLVIGSLDFAGGPYTTGELEALFAVTRGDPYVPDRIRAGREKLISKLGADGYLYSAVTVDEPVRSEGGTVLLMVTITEGPRVRIGRIIISGNENVDARIIRLALGLQQGDVLNLEEVLKAQERVYRLGMMAVVDISLADREVPAAEKDVLVRIKERNRYVLNLRVGYGSEDRFRSEFTATMRNLARMTRTLTLGARASAIEQQASLTYGHPWFTGRPIDLTASLVDLEEERESFSRDSTSVLLDLTREVTETTTTRLAYSFEGLRLFNVSPDAQLSPEDEGQTDVAALIPEVLFDSRDDYLEPRSGILADLRLEVADASLGSEAEFYKIEVSGRRYTPVFADSVLAVLLRLGYVRSYGSSEEVLISKRFFLGGQNSVRGYALDSLGPVDASGDPIGGNYLVNANLELRYPISGTFGGVIFVDSGSVWLREDGGETFKLRLAAGSGIRWSSPIGPLSLDYGYKLNPAAGDDDLFRWHISIGHAF